ncbi:dihydroorotate dehydrogenase B (NAD(+)), electron transfer subunit [Pullulanibacillus camelliae]|uniref:Dihydroorotate dehydrogenase B (NAD(+)), electron transfer subunit n=1 Tax=Pullulanibacillus camelliae TaxID=1707096 RepID=A0A8J2VLL5_9BACL|nr:dihydroorotate dehydrogenase electron transfer subunit [Pullulanibacillus camelliae]GGE27524.1 dihydroorotate dehydrogenase B (NAD(+)), electron transfer subunit [Pullulanibacillus camelliae]
MRDFRLKVVFNQQVSQRYWHLCLDASSIQEDIKPGQFFNIFCSDYSTEPFLRRPFSLYHFDKMHLEFLYAIKGVGTKALTHYQKGDTLNVLGPLGQFFQLPKNTREILLLARGVGIATLAALAYEAYERGIKVVGVLSARTNDDLVIADTLQSLGMVIYKVTDENKTSDIENVMERLSFILKQRTIDAVYTCGSRRLTRLLQRVSSEYGIYGEVALEENMGCSVGVCYACVCQIKEKEDSQSVRICREGPVFPLEKVLV